jgi:hypothetical protein
MAPCAFSISPWHIGPGRVEHRQGISSRPRRFRCTRATQCCSLRQAASSIELLNTAKTASSIALLNTAKAALSIELRANYRITEKGYRSWGIEPAEGVITSRYLTDDLGKSQPQPSILLTICNVNASVNAIFWTNVCFRRCGHSDAAERIGPKLIVSPLG